MAWASALLVSWLGAHVSEHAVPTEDGARLRTVVYSPAAPWGPGPAVVMRTPYPLPTWIDEAADLADDTGVAFVFQTVRGREGSTGAYCFFACDVSDADATLAWLDEQPWFDGRAALTGTSAPGMLALLGTVDARPSLRTAFVSLGQGSLYDAVFPGGVLRMDLEGWLHALVPEPDAWRAWSRFLAEHPVPGPAWAPSDVNGSPGRVGVPILHVTGWYDLNLDPGVDAFVALQRRGGPGAAGRQRLVVHPFGHATSTEREGDMVSYGDIEMALGALQTPYGTVEQLERRWLLDAFGDPDPELRSMPAVTYWRFGDPERPSDGGNRWVTAETWPPSGHRRSYFLQADGRLDLQCPGDGGPTRYTADPGAPTPTLGGGNLGIPSGPFDQRAVEARPDVAVFTSGPLDEPLSMVGDVRAELHVAIDRPDADLVLRLTDVYPDGRSILIDDGPLRLARRDRGSVVPMPVDQVIEVDVEFGPVAWVLSPGHRLRVSIASSMAPRYFVNPSNGSYYGASTPEPQPVEVRIHHAPGRASRIEVPVLGDAAASNGGTCPSSDRGDEAEVEGCACRSVRPRTTWLWLAITLGWLRRRGTRRTPRRCE